MRESLALALTAKFLVWTNLIGAILWVTDETKIQLDEVEKGVAQLMREIQGLECNGATIGYFQYLHRKLDELNLKRWRLTKRLYDLQVIKYHPHA